MGDAAKNLYQQQGTYRTVPYCCVLLITRTMVQPPRLHSASNLMRPYAHSYTHARTPTLTLSLSHSHTNILAPTYGPPGINGFYRGIEANVMRAMVRTHAQTRVLTQEDLAAHTQSCTHTDISSSVISSDAFLFLSLHIFSHSFLFFSPIGSKRHKDVMLRSNQGNQLHYPYCTFLTRTPLLLTYITNFHYCHVHLLTT